jgi:Uma2 family endonuclease
MTPATVASPPAQPPTAPNSGPAVLIPPGIAPVRYRWTISAYRKLAGYDLFNGLKTMLIDGEIFSMPLPAPPHDLSLGLVDDWLRAVFAVGHHVRNQMGFDVGIANDPGPDLAVIAGSRRDLAGRTPTTAVLIVEIAHTTLQMDTTTKAELYATAAVQEYWVIDIEHRQLIVFRDPQPLPTGLGATAYRTHLTFGPADRVSPLSAPQASVLVGDLLP